MKRPDDPEHLALGDWITTEEAARIIGVTTNHVRYLAKLGTIESRRFGRSWMINRASAEAYAATERRPGPKPRESSGPD
jgi:excisionase family DNA binding protein